MRRIPDVVMNGDRERRLQPSFNISFRYIEGEGLLINLDLEGVAVSTGSACSSGTLEPSPVIRALGVDDELARGSIRFSFGKDNTEAEVEYAVEVLVQAVERLRALSPLIAALLATNHVFPTPPSSKNILPTHVTRVNCLKQDVVAEQSNPVCGDRLRLSLIVNDDRIEAARYLAYGCPPTLVCGSVLTELITGKTTAEAKNLTRKIYSTRSAACPHENIMPPPSPSKHLTLHYGLLTLRRADNARTRAAGAGSIVFRW